MFSLVFAGLLTAAASAALPDDGAERFLGLHATTELMLTDGHCEDCPALPQALWYFADERIALRTGAYHETVLPAWLDNLPAPAYPHPPIWIGAGSVIPKARLSEVEDKIELSDGRVLDFGIVPKIASNLSYWDENTRRFFTDRPLRLRGEFDQQGFIARSVWPLDFTIDAHTAEPLGTHESLRTLIRQGSDRHHSRLLWQRPDHEAGEEDGHAVLALMLNGAQGDDHEALAGHFAVVTGRHDAGGHYHNWLVNNFYNLDSFNEKAIIAAPTPLDRYLADLNSGQNYYRPSYMLVALLDNDRTAMGYQQAIDRLFQHFYRHDFLYNHANANCSSLSIDTLRALGWQVPEQGAEGYVKAIGGYVYTALTRRSLREARQVYDYLSTESTRLLPARAFEAIGEDLLMLANDSQSRLLSDYERQLQQDLAAIWLVQIPQIPSSRAQGSAPVFSFGEYLARTPSSRDDWQTVDSPPRAFPDSLRTRDPVNPPPGGLPLPVMLLLLMMLLPLAALPLRRRRRQRNAQRR